MGSKKDDPAWRIALLVIRVGLYLCGLAILAWLAVMAVLAVIGRSAIEPDPGGMEVGLLVFSISSICFALGALIWLVRSARS